MRSMHLFHPWVIFNVRIIVITSNSRLCLVGKRHHEEALLKEAVELRGLLKRIRANIDESDEATESSSPTQGPLMRQSYRTPQRAKALRLVQAWGISKTSRETNIPIENLKRWIKNGPSRKKGSGRKKVYSELEERLVRWVHALSQRSSAYI